ncbi:unnamed protein product [Ceratitis capitata]|uniref:(Mediterranean fruit fly) hypothetical protein n=1 Tax=Ceratitis capitata TaxID=7213 RepID=A0A811USE6_CERCA|nr:unnamed protein product [Ceratitis capitata]
MSCLAQTSKRKVKLTQAALRGSLPARPRQLLLTCQTQLYACVCVCVCLFLCVCKPPHKRVNVHTSSNTAASGFSGLHSTPSQDSSWSHTTPQLHLVVARHTRLPIENQLTHIPHNKALKSGVTV